MRKCSFLLAFVLLLTACNSSRKSTLYDGSNRRNLLKEPNIWANGRSQKIVIKPERDTTHYENKRHIHHKTRKPHEKK